MSTPAGRWKIPPSGFYDWPYILAGKKCGRHEWDRLNQGLVEPSKPFPTLFGKIDLAMRKATEGRSVSEVLLQSDAALLGNGTFYQHKGKLSNEIRTANGAVIDISGYLDCYVRHNDGKVTVVDFKCRPIGDRESMERSAKNYLPQLSAYASAINKKSPGKVKGMGILWQGPDAATPVAEAEKGSFSLRGGTMYIPLELNLDKFAMFLDSISAFLSSERPPAFSECETCVYQSKLRSLASE